MVRGNGIKSNKTGQPCESEQYGSITRSEPSVEYVSECPKNAISDGIVSLEVEVADTARPGSWNKQKQVNLQAEGIYCAFPLQWWVKSVLSVLVCSGVSQVEEREKQREKYIGQILCVR